jgi:glycopeptide antibiotics resistance protein
MYFVVYPGATRALPGYDRSLGRILAIVIGLILYGSTYPWKFGHGHAAWRASFNAADFAVNVAVYIPLGLFGRLAFGARRPWIPVLLALGLSISVELLQSVMSVRRSSVYDIVANAVGTALGMAAAAALQRIGRDRRTDARAIILLLCGCSFFVFPVQGSSVALAAVVLAAGVLLERAGARPVEIWLAVGAAAVWARQPSLGAVAGWVLFLLLRARPRLAASTFLAAVIFIGLWPFQARAETTNFNWLPFGGLLEAEWVHSVRILSQKLYLYGSGVWLLQRAGATMTRSAIAVAIVLFAIEAAHVHLAGRTPDITDPLLAILAAVALDAFRGTASEPRP